MKVQERPDTTSTIITNLSASIRQTGRGRFYSLPCTESQKRGTQIKSDSDTHSSAPYKAFLFCPHSNGRLCPCVGHPQPPDTASQLHMSLNPVTALARVLIKGPRSKNTKRKIGRIWNTAGPVIKDRNIWRKIKMMWEKQKMGRHKYVPSYWDEISKY